MRWLFAATLTVAAASAQNVFINEIHYDNTGTDTGEFVEIAGPAGTDLTGWTLVRYNGANGQTYSSPGNPTLSGSIPNTTGNGFGVVVLNYPQDGLQNGSPDGLALVDPTNTVVQFLCYEGIFAAVDGPASGMTCTDIGVSEPGTTPVGQSLQLTGTGNKYSDFTWSAPAAHTSGAANIGQTFQAPLMSVVFINEIHYDNSGTDTGEFIELAGTAGKDLTGWTLVRYNGANGQTYSSPGNPTLSGTIPNTTGAGFGFVVLNYPQDGLQNGSPDGLALVDNNNTVVQFLCYEGTFAAVNGPASGMTCTDIGVSEPGTTPIGQSLQLIGTGNKYEDFTWSGPIANTSGAINTGQSFTGGGQISTNPSGTGAANPNPVVAGGQTLLTVTVTPGANPASTGLAVTADLSSIGGSATQAFTGNGNSFTFNATVTAGATPGLKSLPFTITDAQSRSGSGSIALTVNGPVGGVCGDPATLISTVQGTGATSPLNNQLVTIEGIVTGDFQPRTRDGVNDPGLSGFFLQDAGDGLAETSDGIFIFQGNTNTTAVNPGDRVRVTGTVFEFGTAPNTLTEISPVQVITVCSAGNPLPAPLSLSLPVSSLAIFERYEGMRVTIPQPLFVVDTTNHGDFSEIGVASSRLITPTQVVLPGAPALALQDLNNRSRFILDDGSSLARANFNPPAYLYPDGGLTAGNTARIGDRINVDANGTYTPITGIFEQRFGSYRLHPTVQPVFGPTDNPRPVTPATVGGTLRVASFNVLNYFTSFVNGACGTGNQDCRGANSAAEFTRQRDKIINAIATMDAHIVGLLEIENNTAAVQDLVSGLNAFTFPGKYSFINTGIVGTDAIRVAFIYQPAAVSPVGNFAVLNNAVDPRALDTQNRPSIAQTFQRINGPKPQTEKFTVVVNHFKSKGSGCGAGDPNLNDGQDDCNLTRVSIAQAIIDWLKTDPTGSGDPDFLIMGDLNAYAMEDPIRALTDPVFSKPGFPGDASATYINLAPLFDANAYSYVFSGQTGSLDHALANPSLERLVTGVTEWHINADEPEDIDYNVEWTSTINKNANQLVSLYAADPFRASDHDPILIGVNLVAGDFDNDGDVDAADQTLIRAALNQTVTNANRRMDMDRDGRITTNDYRLWLLAQRDWAAK